MHPFTLVEVDVAWQLLGAWLGYDEELAERGQCRPRVRRHRQHLSDAKAFAHQAVGKGLRLQVAGAQHCVAVVAHRVPVHPALDIAPVQLPPRHVIKHQAAMVAKLLADVVQQRLVDAEVDPHSYLGALLLLNPATPACDCDLRGVVVFDTDDVTPQVGGET